MLTFFPSSYEDELLYSLLARYARLTGYSNLKTNLNDLFRRTTVTAVADLPTHLGALAERLAPLGGLSADEMIDCYTLFPYYAAFQPLERRRRVREAMRGDGYPHGLLGLMAARGPALTERFALLPGLRKRGAQTLRGSLLAPLASASRRARL